ncbi:MAG: hypothetical protein HYZ57_19870 [Acidobacteria bacterium]|nr:hypothetical protein [Acidobacteriota bacterium]
MKYLAAALLLGVCAFAQQRNASTYTFDVNGRRVPGAADMEARAAGAAARLQTTTSVNGRNVPIQSVEERVVADGPGLKVVERTIRRFDANGNPGPPEKVRVEERRNPDGSARIVTTVERGDINGHLRLAERSVSDIRKAADTTTTVTQVERPTHQSVELVERREEKRQETPGGKVTEQSSVYRRDSNGRFQEAARSSLVRSLEGGTMVENAASYERAAGGGMELLRQTQSRAVRDPRGAERTEVDVFEPDLAGRVTAPGERDPKLRERRVIERTPANGGFVETVSVARTAASDPATLGALQKVEETVCTGDCKQP